jgi:hypothetical protein
MAPSCSKSNGRESEGLYQIFERTDFCPYTDRCESYQTISRAESWIERAMVRLRQEITQGLHPGDGSHSIENLQWRLDHLRKVKERCYGYNGRCLRFWQFKSDEDGKPLLRMRPRVRLPRLGDEEVVVSPAPTLPDEKSSGSTQDQT